MYRPRRRRRAAEARPDGSATAPLVVPGISGAAAIALGDSATYVVLSDGSVVAFGSDHFGQLGDGMTSDRPSAAPVAW